MGNPSTKWLHLHVSSAATVSEALGEDTMMETVTFCGNEAAPPTDHVAARKTSNEIGTDDDAKDHLRGPKAKQA